MRTLPGAVLLLLMLPSVRAADETPARVELYRSGPKELTNEASQEIVNWTEKFLKSANFNTASQPQLLKQSVATVQEHYRKTVRGDYLVVSYPRPMNFKTAGGEVTAVEIIVGLNRQDPYPSGFFTIDSDGRVIAHEKYDPLRTDGLAPEATTRDSR